MPTSAHTPASPSPSPSPSQPSSASDARTSAHASPLAEFPTQLARTHRFSFGEPDALTVSGDGSRVFFLRSRAGDDPVTCLWAHHRATGEEELLADPAVLDPAAAPADSPTPVGVTAYASDRDGTLLAFALAGRLWTVRPAEGAGSARRLTTAAEPVADPRPSPTGRHVAYVSGGALRVVSTATAVDRAVALPDGPEVVYGVPEHITASSMGRDRGYWWAPDGRRLLVARVDPTPVKLLYLADHTDPERPPTPVRYPTAGTANAAVSLWLADLPEEAASGEAASEEAAGGAARLRPVDWDTEAFEYLARAAWDAFGPYVTVQSRDQRHLRHLAVDPATGATTPLGEQHDPAWLHLAPGLPARTASGALLTSVDDVATDTRHLVVDGRPVTPPGLQLLAVTAVDGDTVLFTASTEPTESHLWRYDVARQDGPHPLSQEPGVHAGTGRGGTTVLVSRTLRRYGTRVTVLDEGAGVTGATDATGGTGGTIASHAEECVLPSRVEILRLGPLGLRAALFLPSTHSAERDGPLPVLMDPYGGPAMRRVTAEHTWRSFVPQWFAENGFAVLVVDGRGTPDRSPAWERTVHLDVATPVLEDQVTGLAEAAARFPGLLDTTRVAIRGWSYGGFLAALAVLRRPDVFHAAIAGAAISDQRMYGIHWRERHLGHPDEHPEAYDRCSTLPEAATLSRPLLLVQGLADDNVLPAHTFRLSAALLAAGRPHEVLPLPGAGHRPTDPAQVAGLLGHELAFLRRVLPGPPAAAGGTTP
ncbi:prolyl oligopeptidase family serine peptidase [Streptomyces sp. 4N509B]|uniref:prolyl oligopeptidase family serine peptidase n=1 Tax=Streptomyces sp. 4N509B TaxID=3457413 RepID=UPI003FD0188A